MKKNFTLKIAFITAFLLLSVIGFAANINVSGTIASNTTWNADTVKVLGNVTVNNNVTLTISAGTYVQFQGHYSLNIQGTLLAIGASSNKIEFSALNTNIGWSGIRFDNTATTNAQSMIEYCEISYGKANTGTSEEKMGGAIFVKGTSDLIIRNNILSNNSATFYGGAITCRYGASPTIANNIICNNSANSSGGGIYLFSNSVPKIANNTIVNNSASNGGGINANAVDPYIYNNIIYGNTASANPQLTPSLTYVNYNLIEGGYGNNLSSDPQFVNPSSGVGILYDGIAADWTLQSASPARDKGYPYASTVQSYFLVADFDAYGNFRFDNEKVDIGAVEYISSIEACGTISSNTTWSGTVLVNCEVTVANGVTLTIQPGTKVLFTGHHRIRIQGRLLAQGNHDNKIEFTPWDKVIGWDGLYIYNVAATNDTTFFEYCDINYSNRTSNGGAFYLYYSNKTIVRNCIISNNKAAYGGAVYMNRSNAKFISNLIVNNEATGSYSGAFFIYGTSSIHAPQIINNTIAYNKASSYAAGIYENSSAVPEIKNNIIYQNEDASGNHLAMDNIYPVSGGNVTYCLIEGGYSGTGNISSNPLFKSPSTGVGASYSIKYRDFSIQSTSPAVDAGSTSTVGLNLPVLDLKGIVRKYNNRVDIGSYENKALLSLACSGSTTTISTDQTWDASVIEVNCNVVINTGATVTINPGTEVNFKGNYSITVNGAIDARGTSSNQIVFTPTNTTTGWDGIHVYPSAGNDSSIFENCKFEYSKRTTATGQNGGGAMTIRGDEVRVSKSTFTNNQTSGSGGAVHIYNSHPTVENCTLSYNTGGNGGAIYVFYYKSTPESLSPIVRNNLISYNTGTNGGGMYFYAPESEVYNNKIVNNTATYGGGIYYSGNRISEINNNLIANNTASLYGGGLYLGDCKASFINNTIANNRANTYGGGIYCKNNSDPVLKNTIIYGNKQNSSLYVSSQIYLSDILSDPKIYNCDIEGGSAAFLGGGAGSNYQGVYTNVLTVNPSFTSPTTSHGTGYSAISADFSLQQGSMAINTGVEDVSGLILPDYDIDGDDRLFNGRIDMGAYENQDDIVSPCVINSDLVWDADVVKVNCNVTISNGATLEIRPGTKVLFTGKYGITVNGAIQAKGEADKPIQFTASNLVNFTNLSIDQGGWSGIWINSPATSNDSSLFDYCNFSYGKASGAVTTYQKGGALYVFNNHKVAVTHCKFSNNAARSQGGALCIESSNITFHNNLVVNNHADNTNNGEGGGLRIDDSSIDFKNNTIANNSSKHGAGVFIYSSTSPSFEGSIFYGNQTIGYSFGRQIHTLLCTNISFIDCDIQGGKTGISDYYHISVYQGNLNTDPLFVSPTAQYGLSYKGLTANWELSTVSPLINAELNSTFFISFDLSGQPRKVADTLDIGAYEVQMSPRFITEQPDGNEFCVGTSAVISAKASISANYQWQKNGVNISGAANRVLNISSIVHSDTAFYNCIVSSNYGSVSTDTVWVGTKVPPSVVSHPSATNACVGSSATFSTTIDGTSPITYQWLNTNGALGAGTNSSYNIVSASANDASTYRLKASNSCGQVFTNGALLTINTAPIVTPITALADVCENGSNTFTTSATGTSPITYQWYKNSSSISSANSVSYTISSAAISNAGNYYCIATNACGNDQTNQSVLTVKALPSITVQPTSASVCESQSYTFSVTAAGGSPLSYQWYKGGVIINSANNNTFTISSIALSDAASYYCVVTNSCNSVTSATATLTVNIAPSISSQTSNVDVCSGSAAAFSITATGTAPITYQWYNSSGIIASATNNTYTISGASVSNAGNYYCKITNSCGTVNSNPIPLVVNSSPSIITQPIALTKCIGQSALLMIQASGTSPLTFQWYKGANAITGANGNTLLISPITSSDADNYYCKVTNSCGNVNSNTVALTVKTGVSISAQSSSQIGCSGASSTFSITALGSSPITYQWYKDNISIPSATNNSLSLTSIDTSDAAAYYIIATNSCSSVQSNLMSLNVDESPSIISQPISTNACAGSSVMLSMSATGTAPLVYQWYKGVVAIAGATSSTYIIGSSISSDAGSYYCKVTNNCGNQTSNSAVLSVNDPVFISSQSGDSTKCVGESMQFTVSITGSSPLTYQWYRNGVAITGGTSAVYSITSVSTSDLGDYYCTISNVCNSVQSSVKTLNVNVMPSITQQSGDSTVCSGTNLSLSVSANGSGPIAYQWYKNSTSIGGAVSSINPLYQINNSDAGVYYNIITNNCGSVQSSNINIIVNSSPSIVYQSSDSARCEGESMTFEVNANGSSPLTYQWYKGANMLSGTDSIYKLNSVNVSDIGNYHVVVTNSCASISSTYKYLTVHATPAINLGNDTTYCEGGSTIIGPGYGYYCVWNNGLIASQLNITDSGSYSAQVTDQFGCKGATDTINIDVVQPFEFQDICVVTIDSATGKNVVVWEKVPNVGITSFNVYKESNVSGVYNIIANQPVDSLSLVLDLTSNPTVSPERYVITVLDTCGNESAYSQAHRTMHLTVNKGQNNDWNLIWNAYEGFTPNSYKIYRADTTLNYVNIATVAGSSSFTYLYTDNTTLANQVYYYYVEVIHPNGGCSATKAKTNYNSSRSNHANNGTASPVALAPAFFGTPTTGVFPLDVHFFDQTIGDPVEWLWDFGDGTSDSVQHPTHSYTQIGVYSVSLLVKDAFSANSIVFQNYISVLTTGIAEISEEFDVKVFPNPYSNQTTIAYALNKQSKVQLEVFTAQGKKVARLVDNNQGSGSYKMTFNAQEYGFSSGVYYLRMTVDGQVYTKKLIQVK